MQFNFTFFLKDIVMMCIKSRMIGVALCYEVLFSLSVPKMSLYTSSLDMLCFSKAPYKLFYDRRQETHY